MHACIRRGILSTSSWRSSWSRLSHFSMDNRRRSLSGWWVISFKSSPFQCIPGMVDSVHVWRTYWPLYSSDVVVMKELIHKMCSMRARIVVHEDYFLSKFCQYGCSIGQMMSFLYRIAVSAPSMISSGVRRPHIMPPQNIREPPPCCTCWIVCLRRSAWPDSLKTRLWWLSGWRHMRHSSVNRTWCKFWRVHSVCFWAHLYHAAWCLGVKYGSGHGRREWSCASCSLFRTVWVESRRPVAARKALFSTLALLSQFFELHSTSIGHQLQ